MSGRSSRPPIDLCANDAAGVRFQSHSPSPRLPCKLTMTERLDQQDEDTVLDTNAEVSCPYCGETVALALATGGGALQE